MLYNFEKIANEYHQNNALIIHKSVFEKSYFYSPLKMVGSETGIYYHLSYKTFLTFLRSITIKNTKKHKYLLIDTVNPLDIILFIYLCWHNNIIPVPINQRLSDHEKKQIIDELNTAIVFSSDETRNPTINIHDKKTKTDTIPNKSADETAIVLYTSGTGGTKKGVLLSFSNLINSYRIQSEIFCFHYKDKWLVSLPLYHIGGFAITFRALLSGASVTIPESLKAEHVLDAIIKTKTTRISLVPTQLHRIINLEQQAPKHLTSVFIGGAASDSEMLKNAEKLGYPICKVYGSTETTAFVTALKPKSDYASVGKPLPEVKINIIDNNGNECQTNESGEIIIQSPTIMKGYLNNFPLTNVVLKNGFYHTGDFGYIDEKKNVMIECRKDNLIITGGENVVPDEVTDALLSLENVIDAEVIGLQDEEWGEIIAAAIVLKKKKMLTYELIKQQLKHKLAPYKIPKKIIFTDAIPRNELGKPDKTKLIKLLV